MTRSRGRLYLRLWADFPDRKGGYPDRLVVTYLYAMCHALNQPRPGTFRFRAILAAYLGRRLAKNIPELIARGDLVERSDGSLYVDGWNEYQEGDWTSWERQARVRRRHAESNGPSNAGSAEGTSTGIGIGRENVTGPGRPGLHNGQHGRNCLVCAAYLEEVDRVGSYKVGTRTNPWAWTHHRRSSMPCAWNTSPWTDSATRCASSAARIGGPSWTRCWTSWRPPNGRPGGPTARNSHTPHPGPPAAPGSVPHERG